MRADAAAKQGGHLVTWGWRSGPGIHALWCHLLLHGLAQSIFDLVKGAYKGAFQGCVIIQVPSSCCINPKKGANDKQQSSEFEETLRDRTSLNFKVSLINHMACIYKNGNFLIYTEWSDWSALILG